MRIIIVIAIIFFSFNNSKAQFTTLTSDGNWSNVLNWNNGIPNAASFVTIPSNRALIVDISGSCDSFTMLNNTSLTVNAGVILLVNGLFAASLTPGANVNNGTIILRGGLEPTIGNQVLTINGGVTTTGGLTFPTFSID